MKERHWTNLVSSLRQGQCILALGPEVPADSGEAAGSADTPVTYVDALKDRLAKELEEDGRRVTATNLAGVAQQYEDAEVFGQGAFEVPSRQVLRVRTIRTFRDPSSNKLHTKTPIPGERYFRLTVAQS